MARKDNRGRNLQVGESQRKDGKYQYRYEDLDGERKTVYSWKLVKSDKMPQGKKEDISLREKEEDIQELLRKGLNNRGRYLTLNDMFDIYLERKRHKGKPLAYNTKTNYQIMWNKHIRNSTLGNKKLLDIVKSDIVYLYEELQEKNISYGTITFFNKVLSSVFNMAIDDEILSKNPTKRALNDLTGEQQKKNSLTIAQQKELLSYAKKHNYSMYQKLVVLIETMCRISELAGVIQDNIDMKNRMITIDHQLKFLKLEGDEKATYHIMPTKSRKSRIIPMTDEVFKVIKESRKQIPDKKYTVDGKTGFLFYTASGKLVYGSLFLQELNRFMIEYNLTAKNKIEHLTPHVLRHTGCTRNAERGMDIKVLQYLMGHSSSKITNDVYNHVNEERAKEELKRTGIMQDTSI